MPADPPVFDVVIVGAGLMGSAAAYYAAARGASVLLLEQHHFLHSLGSSSGESRICRLTYPSALYTGLAKHAYRLWAAAEEESGMHVFNRRGGLDILPAGSATLEALTSAATRFDIPFELLSAAEIASRFGFIVGDDKAGIYQADTGTLRATTSVAMFQSLAARHGATLRDRACVSGLHTDAADGTVTLTIEGGASVRARKAILASGPWAVPLLQRLLGISLRLQVWQTAYMYFKAAGGAGAEANARALRALPVFIDYGSEPIWTSPAAAVAEDAAAAVTATTAPCIYSCPCNDDERPGLIKIGVHQGRDCTATTRTFVPDHAVNVAPVQAWLRAHAAFLDPEPASVDTCLYTMTPDEDFVIDLCPSAPSVVIACGFSGHGFKFGTVIGEILASLALTGTTEHDISAFRIARPSLALRTAEEPAGHSSTS